MEHLTPNTLAQAQATEGPEALDNMLTLLAKQLIQLQTIAGGTAAASAARSSSVTFARTADTNAYAANDVVGATGTGGGVLSFTDMAASAGQVLLINSATLVIDRNTVPSGMAGFRLHLFKDAPTSVDDNAAFPLTSAGDKAGYLGYIDFALPTLMGAVLVSQATSVNLQMVGLTGTTLYGELQTLGAFTPASATSHTITLRAVAP